MKKEVIAAVLFGMLLPAAVGAAAGALCGRGAPPPEQETLPRAEEPAALDAVRRVGVRLPDGETEEMTLQEYLVGVVLAEMPAEFEPQALQAQAVVARTYTCRRLGRSRHGSAAVCTDPDCCQGYCSPRDYLARGGTQACVEKIRSAVADTDALVLTYRGELIDATYFSCSGGFTEDAVEVWGQDVPYLQAVESPGEEEAPRFEERVHFSRQELQQRLGVGSDAPVSDWFGASTQTAGGGVGTIRICGESFSGRTVRKLLGLRSTAFRVEAAEEGAVFVTRGFGHRVGMSQYGAQAMAKQGSDLRTILSHYYQNTELTRLEHLPQE